MPDTMQSEHPQALAAFVGDALLVRVGVVDDIRWTPTLEEAARVIESGDALEDIQLVQPTVTRRLYLPVATASDVVDSIMRGFSLRMMQVDNHFEKARELRQDVENIMGRAVHVNLYLSPPHSQGLPRHSDEHDILVVQCHGKKQWDIEGSGVHRLRPPLALFIPRGVAHHALCLDEPSIHLTLGLNSAHDGEPRRRGAHQHDGMPPSTGTQLNLLSRLRYAALPTQGRVRWVGIPVLTAADFKGVFELRAGPAAVRLPEVFKGLVEELAAQDVWRLDAAVFSGAEALQTLRYLVKFGALVVHDE